MSSSGRRKRKLEEKKTESIKVFECIRCLKTGSASFLSFNFKVLVCDDCRDNDNLDKLITKTEMIKKYKIPKWPMDDFLKEYPNLVKANPRHERGNPMVLIYEKHAEEFAIKFHGSLDVIEKKIQENKENKNAKLTNAKVTQEKHLENLALLAGGVDINKTDEEKNSETEDKSVKSKTKKEVRNKKPSKKKLKLLNV